MKLRQRSVSPDDVADLTRYRTLAYTQSGEASPKTATTVRRGTPDSEQVELGAENNSSKDHRCTVSLRCGQCFTVHHTAAPLESRTNKTPKQEAAGCAT
eukprot:s899_g16.t1